MFPQYGELRPTSGWDRSGSLGHPCKCQWVSCLGSVTAWHSSSGRQPDFAALNRGATYIRQGDHHVGPMAHILVMVALCNRADHYIFAVIYIFFSGPHNMVKFGLLTAEICLRVWGTPANFNGFRVLATLLHGTLVVDVSQTLQLIEQRAPPIFCRATIMLGIGPHSSSFFFSSPNLSGPTMDVYHK